ncbi:MAG: ribbon-helix-helix protein, CopG family [Alphaproteobacteria bacterium]|jgi:predicted transcriptional regulator|nr:ribbon-helix-helix protein, CopG family [Alphaproteobacteria bacterium]
MDTKDTNQLVADPNLMRRVDALANRTRKSKADIFNDALRNGLDWEEDFVDRIQQGVEAADRGEFAAAEDVDRVFNKYRPA